VGEFQWSTAEFWRIVFAQPVLLTIPLTVAIPPCVTSSPFRTYGWRRGSESNGAFTDCQPQYPDFQGYFNTGFTGVQAVFDTIRHIPGLTRRIPAAYPVIEEIVEGFVEGLSITL
jgi:hypothetical protein